MTAVRTRPIVTAGALWLLAMACHGADGWMTEERVRVEPAARVDLTNNSPDRVRRELLAPGFISELGCSLGLTNRDVAPMRMGDAGSKDELQLDRNGVPAGLLDSVAAGLRDYLAGRWAGHTKDYLLRSNRARRAAVEVVDPDLRMLLREHPEIPADRPRKEGSGIREVWPGKSCRWVSFVIPDGEIATTYELFFTTDGLFEWCSGAENTDIKDHDPTCRAVLEEVRQSVEAQMKKDGTFGKFGSCHTFWELKKARLKEKGIVWRSPRELNPLNRYD